ncbi:MAG TPA: solute-binding protein [Candidatus Poseidoniaceae archaeon]|nr:MAG TPA: tungsten ABC transporter substrate-binding protein [Candidatus Poseidoniales archaeon]HIH53383.1 solute-binding protein [Candidatus Poseidoniaceae archaeon]
MRALLAGLLCLLVLSPGCVTPDEDRMILATTTSMRDSGLLEVLLPAFTNATGHEVDVVAVGTGAALNLGRSGDADVLIVHAPEAEMEFLEEGHGSTRSVFAWNTFVLLTPEPMNGSLFDVLDTLVANEQCFVSRGDASGTHIKEQILWQAWADAGRGDVVEDSSGVHPAGDWYLSIGQGMGAAITMADEKRCVTLSDLGTALFRAETVDLDLQRYDDEVMVNPYSIIPLDGPHAAEAEALRTFLLTEAAQLIDDHTVSGEPMFTPGQP